MKKNRKNGEQIKTSEKDFRARAKSYPDAIAALNEIITNSFFVKWVTSILISFFIFNNKKCFLVKNDGEFFSPANMENAIRNYGCVSANTAGNENGTGLKTNAAYFTDGNKDSFLLVISKSKYGEYSYGLIAYDGQTYIHEEDFDDNDISFIDYIKKHYLNDIEEGTITTIYDAAHTDDLDVSEI